MSMTHSDMAIRAMFRDKAEGVIVNLQSIARALCNDAIVKGAKMQPDDRWLMRHQSPKQHAADMCCIGSHINVFIHQAGALTQALSELREKKVLKAEVYISEEHVTGSNEPGYTMNISPFTVLIEAINQDVMAIYAEAKKPA